MYSQDVMTFAIKMHFIPEDTKKEVFDFAEAYHPISFYGARFNDARIWSFFMSFVGDTGD